jgi:hypothetical protein
LLKQYNHLANKRTKQSCRPFSQEIDPTDDEQTSRYRRKIQKDEDFLQRTAALSATLEGLVRLNSAVDETTDYKRARVGTMAVFKDPLRDRSVQPRSVSALGEPIWYL